MAPIFNFLWPTSDLFEGNYLALSADKNVDVGEEINSVKKMETSGSIWKTQ